MRDVAGVGSRGDGLGKHLLPEAVSHPRTPALTAPRPLTISTPLPHSTRTCGTLMLSSARGTSVRIRSSSGRILSSCMRTSSRLSSSSGPTSRRIGPKSSIVAEARRRAGSPASGATGGHRAGRPNRRRRSSRAMRGRSPARATFIVTSRNWPFAYTRSVTLSPGLSCDTSRISRCAFARPSTAIARRPRARRAGSRR